MNILGINAYHGNASAAIVCDGQLVAAVEEERFNRVKYAAGFPSAAIRYCLKEAGLTLADVDHVAVPRNPFARLGTKLFYAARMPSFARERIKVLAKFTGIPKRLPFIGCRSAKNEIHFFIVSNITSHIWPVHFTVRLLGCCAAFRGWARRFCEHHVGRGLWPPHQHRWRDCVSSFAGLFYTAVTQYLGFLKFGDEYKVMGLGALREPEFLQQFREIVRSNGKGFRLGLGSLHFTHHHTGRNELG